MCPPLSKDEYYPVFLVAPAGGQIMAGEGEGGGGQLVTTEGAASRNIDVLLIRTFSQHTPHSLT